MKRKYDIILAALCCVKFWIIFLFTFNKEKRRFKKDAIMGFWKNVINDDFEFKYIDDK